MTPFQFAGRPPVIPVGVVIWEMTREGFVAVNTVTGISGSGNLIVRMRVHTVRLEPSVGVSFSLKDASSLRLGNAISRFFATLETDFLPPPLLDDVLYPSPLLEELGADLRAVLAWALFIPLVGGGGGDWVLPVTEIDVLTGVDLPLTWLCIFDKESLSISPAGTREFLGGIEGRNPLVAVTPGVEDIGGMSAISSARFPTS